MKRQKLPSCIYQLLISFTKKCTTVNSSQWDAAVWRLGSANSCGLTLATKAWSKFGLKILQPIVYSPHQFEVHCLPHSLKICSQSSLQFSFGKKKKQTNTERWAQLDAADCFRSLFIYMCRKAIWAEHGLCMEGWSTTSQSPTLTNSHKLCSWIPDHSLYIAMPWWGMLSSSITPQTKKKQQHHHQQCQSSCHLFECNRPHYLHGLKCYRSITVPVVSHEWIEWAQLHPTYAQFLCSIFRKATNVSSN